MRIFILLIFVVIFGGNQGAVAQNSPIIIELFTSEGCSSCPPADKIFAKWADKPNIIAIGYHVDYWDRLGWRDKFSSPIYTQRQKNYAQKRNSNSIFTPELIVNGEKSVVASNESQVSQAISSATPMPLKLSLNTDNKSLKLLITPNNNVAKDSWNILWGGLKNSDSTLPTTGENSGVPLNHRHAVLALINNGQYNFEKDWQLSMDLAKFPPQSDKYFVLAQNAKTLKIEGSALLNLPK